VCISQSNANHQTHGHFTALTKKEIQNKYERQNER